MHRTIIIPQFTICKNPTHSIALCQWKFEVEAFHLKHRMDKVYAGLKTSGSNVALLPLGCLRNKQTEPPGINTGTPKK